MLRAAFIALAVSVADAKCNKGYDSTELSMAVDAALMELQGTNLWFVDINEKFSKTFAQIHSCTSDPTKWVYPDASTATGLLRRVLDSGELKVAATPWGPYCAPGATSCAGSASNGVQNPTGSFWVDMLDDIVDKLSAHYQKTITIKRVYYDNSDLVNHAVANKPEDVDMSEPYYYLGGFLNDAPRFEHFHFSCVTAASTSSFFTKKGSGMTSTADLVNHISSATSPSGRTMGFIGAGNYDAVSAILPNNVISTYVEHDAIEQGVEEGSFIGGYTSEGQSLDSSLFDIFETGIVSPRAILFRLDEECVCEANNYTPADNGDSETELIIALIVVSSVTLVVALLLAVVILRERQHKPLFMPLLASGGGSAGAEPTIEAGKV